jgi:chromosome segregation ATPase
MVSAISLPNPLSLFENCSSPCHCLSSLSGRVSCNWKVLLMDLSTIACTTCFVLTFLVAPSFYCSVFFLASIASGMGAFYMRQIAAMADLEETAKKLREAKEKFESLAKALQETNHRLVQSNQELSRNNVHFRENNQNLTRANTQLRQQVTELTLQVTQLRESAQRIRAEIARFQQENSHLNTNVRGVSESLRVLDQQILNSRALCGQITTHLGEQQRGLGERLEQLGSYLADLRADNRVHERIQELASLQQQVGQAAARLHEIQLSYASERAQFQTIREALTQLRDQFDQTIREASRSMQSSSGQLQENVAALASERQRINDLLRRHFRS